jgi:hypothetical protein
MWHTWGRGEVFTRFWLGRPEGKRLLGTPRRRWEDNIKRDLRGERDRWGELDSAGSGYGPVSGFCEHGDEPSGSIKKARQFLIIWVTMKFQIIFCTTEWVSEWVSLLLIFHYNRRFWSLKKSPFISHQLWLEDFAENVK